MNSTMAVNSMFSTISTTISSILLPTNSHFSPAEANVTHVSLKSYLDTWNYKLRIYSLIAFSIVGTIGNMLSFLVFVRSKLRLTSHGAYLITLAWVDTFILLLELLLRHNHLSQSDLTCKFFYYIRNMLKMLEAFLLVSLCIERSVFLRFPFRSHKWANLRVSVISIVVQTVIACCLCGYTFGQIVLFGTRCNHRPDDNGLYIYTEFTISTIIGEVITGLIVIVLAVYITLALSMLRQRARRLSCNRAPTNTVDREVTRMTIALAVTFSLFRLPYSVTYMTYFIRHYILHYEYASTAQQMLGQAVDTTSVIAQMNYCVNFVIYLLFWGAFREKLIEIMRCAKPDNGVRRQSSSRRLTETTGFYN